MKLLIFVSVVGLVVMVVMISQVVRQELNRQYLNNSAIDKAAEISRKEIALGELKKELWEGKSNLGLITAQTDELKKKTDNLRQEKSTLEQNLSTCNKEKDEVEKTKSVVTEAFGKQKNEHVEAKRSAQKTIEDLKVQILDREKSICLSVDTTNAEARKLCGLGDAQ